tara:strand:+ start:18644 stop:21871 length:3228 start_codon:yes stop_codon:yes gene_type:complete
MTTSTNSTPEHQESNEVASAHPLARFFLLKTTFGLLFTALLVVGGYMAYLSLTKESLPDLDIPQATITTLWPGADPDTIEKKITQEIEDEISKLKGLKTFSSASNDSFSIIAVEFTAETNSADAMQRLRDAVADAQASLPANAEAPSIQQVSVDDRPVMTVALFGDVTDTTLNEYGTALQKRFETVSGVNEADLGGNRDEVIQILLEPQRLMALGISPTQVLQAINSANLDQPFGEIDSEQIGAVIRLEGQFRSVDDLLNLPISRLGTSLNEYPVRLGELGSVERKLDRELTRAFFSENQSSFQKSIDISIRKTPGADTVVLIEELRQMLSVMATESSWPEELNYAITLDASEQIWDSLIDVFINGLQAMVAVFLILFLVLTWREGLIAGLSIPLSFAGAMLVIWMLNYTLNELVIIGMVLALGLLVDVFILMMEGIHEEIYSNKKSFGQAALATVSRYGIPAFAGQLTTILALAPLMAITGTSGKFIRVLPVTAIACLVVAFAVAMLASVPLSRYLMGPVAKQGAKVKESRADKLVGDISSRFHQWSLVNPLNSKKSAKLWVFSTLFLFLLSLLAASRIPLVLYPMSDGLNLGINIELPPSTTLETSQSVADEIGAILLEKPYFDTMIKQVGRKSPLASGSISSALQPSEGENFIGFSITFVDLDDREAPGYVLANEIRQEITAYLDANVAGANLLVVPETGSPTVGDPVEIRITGESMAQLQLLSQSVQEALQGINGTLDVHDNLGDLKTQIALIPNREDSDFYGISQQDLATQIRFAMSNDKIGVFATDGIADDLDIRMGLNWASRDGQGGGPTKIDELSMVRAFTPDGNNVSLLSLLRTNVSEGPTSIVHSNGARAISVLSKVEGRSVNEIVADVETLLEEMDQQWPAGYAWSIGGESEESAETFGSAGAMLVVALLMVFGVLVIVFGSFSQALILMATMPLALIGTFLGFWIFGMSLSFFAVIGVIALIGVVANNGIVMVDTMNRKLIETQDISEAAAEGAAARLRPIMTTSITTIVGLLPLALGSPMYAPLCYAIIFGLIASTALSLVIVPCLYMLLTKPEQLQNEFLD